jgi:hypothetical protein
MNEKILEAINSELERQKATPAERLAVEPSIYRAMRGKLMESGEPTAVWSTPLSVESALKRHREGQK